MKTTIKRIGRVRVKRDLATLPHAELLTLKMQLDNEIVDIKDQLEVARLQQLQTGSSDLHWYERARCALRLKGRDLQAIQLELSRRKLERRPPGLSAHFVAVAKQRLTAEVFDDILAEARELQKAEV